MTYDIHIGDRRFSSWSLRGWLMLDAFGLPYREHLIGLYSGTMREELATLAPARTVPAMVTPEGWIVTDSIAIAETLAERHPDTGLWPRDGAARALARSMTAEMHAGFVALRSECPMDLGQVWQGFAPSGAVRADLARIESLWALARARHGQDGPWLFGSYTIADAFYAPVAARITGYGLPVGDDALAYVAAQCAHASFRRWRTAGQTVSYHPEPYSRDLAKAPWPEPDPAAPAR